MKSTPKTHKHKQQQKTKEMFGQGIPADQYHLFIASSIPSSANHGGSLISNINSHGFNNHIYAASSHHQVPSFLHPLQQQQQQSCSVSKNSSDDQEKVHGDQDINMVAACHGSIVELGNHLNLQMGRERSSVDHHHHLWSNEEVYALFKIRSTFDNWFPDFTWDHVSRKLEELGFKRSAQKCKEKFEEESCRYLNNNNINYAKNNNYREFSDLDELYDNNEENHQQQRTQEGESNTSKTDKLVPSDKDKEQPAKNEATDNDHPQIVGNPTNDDSDDDNQDKSRKRKREEIKFEKFKGFCEGVVRQIVAKQEEIHNKLIEDMVKREEEKVAREEAWKKRETDRINKELQIRSQEQSLASDRQTKIIEFLNKFTPSTSSNDIVQDLSGSSTNSSALQPQLSHTHQLHQNPKLPINETPPNSATQSPDSQNTTTQKSMSTKVSTNNVDSKTTSHERDEIGKRWPKDEVLALISLKCNANNINNEEKEANSTKGSNNLPLWERISQGMMQLGYKRSAKRCKEKWENINKYFRKTRELNKKRPIDSRTCPYFHQLSALYNNQGPVNMEKQQQPCESANDDHDKQG